MLSGEKARQADTAAPVPEITLGGLRIAAVDRQMAAALLISAAHRRGRKPFYSTSANGEVLARVHADKTVAQLFRCADQILADGQPLVFASRWLCRRTLPERVATTDLFHDVAKIAERERVSFYLFGAGEVENIRAAAAIQRLYPALLITGRSHGYLTGAALEQKVEEINRLAPDILWLGLGVPREQLFVRDFLSRLDRVGVIKTAGGLFDHLAGKTPRAPLWMQQAGFEWLWRASMEPRRLLWRYLSTNPRALYVLLRYSQ
ncbi:WecB/TagA/CpsF family glycosyltransferase [Shinella curvata]|uniref:WecB/TagA/CpsF family glycosyltransferase n=1 Tax=Shinella curvata TaxID=1817964 RepID=A0ABT8XJ25_9HYPH|nr:WecB/TagA/CpsF family glycosyltransferase [Shinella curvata]MCJ8055946.1 WecB/TagA/CpsF family glycosyltransferase [Shinella curvata]MDO6123453.1 WecB/TagA/CpsF family glycosyltransferase [Shinella curvata]